jgi:hypothetical protein
VLGPGHPDIARSLDSLASILSDQGDFADALPLCMRAVDIFERALGLEHPDTPTSVRRTVHTLAALGRTEEAAVLRGKHGVAG